ncbi:hypothetical protein Q4524_05180 [Alteromonas stellipolaris]|uniref:DarT1-associated NADAR antitoxin family protein n=1 Tax=Alteromonas stellipolaris TaxID=233316 RepID=UPI0026E3DC84|nr:hypothetical protein [Alteromonas stellipolaris]MDO6537964.1 hypothetical protein [Alteromonas stellipolaris]
MATRPLFIPNLTGVPGAEERLLEFKWHPGMAKSQKQKSIYELHSVAHSLGFDRVLEISSKSENELGIKLSAFNLLIETKKNKNIFTVETAFQGSKVFSRGGPYKDLFGLDSLSAKKDIRLKESGKLMGFEFFGKMFPLEPRTYFYDWIYINALANNEELSKEVLSYDAFTDIEFNPKKSINCQAHSAAVYLSLAKVGMISDALSSPEDFLEILKAHYTKQKRNVGVQDRLI